MDIICTIHLDIYALLDSRSNLFLVTPLIVVNNGISPESLLESFSFFTLIGELVSSR